MVKYAILKPINLGGQKRLVGEVINETVVESKRVSSLIQSGYLVEIKDTISEQTINSSTGSLEEITIPIRCEVGIHELTTKSNIVIKALEVIQMDAKEAISEIGTIHNEDTLTIIHALDNRKTVKEAALSMTKKLEEFNRNGDE